MPLFPPFEPCKESSAAFTFPYVFPPLPFGARERSTQGRERRRRRRRVHFADWPHLPSCDAMRHCLGVPSQKGRVGENCAAHILLKRGAGSGIVTFSDPPPVAAATLALTGGGANMKFPILEIGSAVFVEEGKAGVVTSFRVLPTC